MPERAPRGRLPMVAARGAATVGAGWSVVREPKIYERFSPRYYASFVEDDNGIRIEFMHNPLPEADEA